MNKILVTGALGQIGSELVPALRHRYGADNVIATDLKVLPPSGAAAIAPYDHLDCTEPNQLHEAVRRYDVGTIYHLAALLSASAEAAPQLAWTVNMSGLYNVLEVARGYGCQVFFPSSIGAFGPRHAARSDAAGHRAAADDHLRRHQGRGRAAVRLLRLALRRRHARAAPARPHLLRRGAGRRHHRLRGGDLLPRHPLRPLHVLPVGRHAPRHDVHARRHLGHDRAHGGRRPRACGTATPTTSRR